MRSLWTCPHCGRIFRRAHQPHSCGVGSRKGLLEGKPEPLVKLYLVLEKILKGFGGVEIVARGHYALFRTTRIFADLVFMSEALRLAILLNRKANDPLFFKIQRMSTHRVGHVAKLRSSAELRAVIPDLKEAYRFAQSEHHRKGQRKSLNSPCSGSPSCTIRERFGSSSLEALASKSCLP